MIEHFGIGIDISSIEKFKNKPFSENQSFYKKIFLDEEITYCLKFKNSSEKFAGKFALKEALLKSISKEIEFSEIITSHLDSKPIVKILDSDQNYRFLASLSHENDSAIAVVISEKIK
jgi:phosphopantetheine--protein transferase-like protein